MTTPIDTTRLRVLLDAVDATEHAYHMCDPVYDERRPAAWHAMDEAQRAFREAWASTSPRALLDEVERLRALVEPPVESEPEPRKVVIWHHRDDEEELPSCDDPDEAVANAIDEQAGLDYLDDGRVMLEEPHLVDDEITLYGYARMEVRVNGERILESVLESVDEDHAEPGGDGTSPTPAMLEAAYAFANAVEDGYESWACEVVETRVVNVREWCAAHRPDWLAQLPATEPEEGGTR